MLSRAFANILGRVPRLAQVPGLSRPLTVAELETKGRYTLKVNVEPFKEPEIKYTIEKDHIRITGKRGAKTGKSDFSHEIDTMVTLPPTVKKDTIKTRFDQGNVVVEGESTVQ